ncbi:MAG: ferritin [Polyangiaceae bacterium]|nr:ferritin [Polyangiaceae bacterium]
MASDSYHEGANALSEESKDLHRAIRSLMEELDAVDWYQQRVEATRDAELAAILAHNRDEEIEHAMMVLEWLRRRNPRFDENARTYLFTEGPVTEVEESATSGGDTPGPADASERKSADDSGSLGIGSLKKGMSR